MWVFLLESCDKIIEIISEFYSLQRIHRWAINGMVHFFNDEKLIYFLDGLKVSTFSFLGELFY